MVDVLVTSVLSGKCTHTVVYSNLMTSDIQVYNATMRGKEKALCTELCRIIDVHLKEAEAKVWHRHPVWFLGGNPVVGYSSLKSGIRLMFWSGKDFDEALLEPSRGKYKDATITYTNVSQIDEKDIKRWLKKSKLIQWDYKNIVKRKGVLLKLR